MKINKVYQGDCLEVMAKFPDNSIDTIITDPPWGLKFMGKHWDHGIPGVRFWEEMLRVAKPGTTLMAFGGTRTHHRLMVAIEDAGWEIRDCISHFHSSDEREMALLESMTDDQVQAYLELHYPNEMLSWVYGSGFPKSTSVSKQLDKAQGMEQEVVGIQRITGQALGKVKGFKGNYEGEQEYKTEWSITTPSTPLAKQFDGYGTALKPAWEPIIVAQKPIEGTYANNAEVWGVAGLNVDGGRVGTREVGVNREIKLRENRENWRITGGSNGSGATSAKGRFPANVLISHSEGCVLRGVKRVKGKAGGSGKGFDVVKGFGQNATSTTQGKNIKISEESDLNGNGYETTEDWDCEPDCAVRLLDNQGGVLSSGIIKSHHHDMRGDKGHQFNSWGVFKANHKERGYGDKGGASRFFKNFPPARFIYSGKASRKERGEGNTHPTVKPLKVLEYLCTLTRTPTGGIVLDPFSGSGTVALAALRTGRDWVLIEKEGEYVEIARERIKAFREAMPEGVQMGLKLSDEVVSG